MSKPTIIEKNPMSIVEVKDALKKIQKRDEELSFRSNRTLEYVNEMAQIKLKDAKALEKELAELGVVRLKPNFIKKIVDVLPRSEKALKTLAHDHSITISNDNIKKMFEVVAKYLPKEKKSKKKEDSSEE